MEYIYAALMLNSASKEVNEENVKKVIDATGTKSDVAKVKALVAALDGVNIGEVISKAAMPVAVAASAPSKESASKEEKKEEESAEAQEKKAEEAAGGLANLFG